MHHRTKSTGYRQKAWDALRGQEWPSVKALADHLGCADSGLRGYVGGLEAHGYVARSNVGAIILARDTGPRAPSYNVNTREFRDWNVSPVMTGAQLKAIVAASGLSISDWLRSIGRHPAEATRLRQMMNGQRPVSTVLAELLGGSTASERGLAL
ncbi:MAG: hypothetical protein DI537_61665, partial [Stutzerimonas stutzeri]